MTADSGAIHGSGSEPWHEFGERLRAFARKRVKHPEDADDLVQTVLSRLLERRDGIDEEATGAWLFTSLRHAVIDHWRSRRGEREQAIGEMHDLVAEQVPEASSLQELSRCLEPMLATLSEEDAEILRQVDLEGAAQTDLAAQLGLSVSGTKSRVQRARRRLRDAFDACCRFETGGRGSLIDWRPGDPGGGPCPPACG